MSESIPEQEPLLTSAAFTANEERLAASIREAGGRAYDLDAVGAGIGAAYILYRLYMARRLREETLSRTVSPASLFDLNQRLFTSFGAQFAATLAPSLIAGYLMGVKEAHTQEASATWVDFVASEYAAKLGEQINQTSGEALVQGYQSQLNRRVAQRVAMDRVINAFGVTPRTMNTLVNIWVSPPTPSTTVRPTRNPVVDRADKLVADAVKRRAVEIGSTESYAAKNQAKALVWLYLSQQGEIAKDAEKVWITARDERVCGVCGPMHKVRVPVQDQFTLPGGVKVWSPGVHPRCRCDIVLRIASLVTTLDMDVQDMAVAKSVWGVVSKARGSDPFDRDASGKFARQESRPSRRAKLKPLAEADRSNPEVQMLMAEAHQMSQEAGVATVAEVFERYGVKDAPPVLSDAPTIGPAPTLTGAPVLSGAPTLGVPQLGDAAPKLRGRGAHRLGLGARLGHFEIPDNSAVLAEMPEPVVLVPKLKKEDAPPKENWSNTPDGRPMYGIFDREINNSDGGLLWSDDSVEWYTAGTSGRGIATLEQGVLSYWRSKVLDSDSMDQLFAQDGRDYGDIEAPNGDALVMIYDDDGRWEYLIDRASYEAAWKSALYGLDLSQAPVLMVRGIETIMPYEPDHSLYHDLMQIKAEEGVEVYQDALDDTEPEFENEGFHPVSAIKIADYLEIPSRIEKMKPIVGASQYYKADDVDGYWGGVMSHRGKWKIVSEDAGVNAEGDETSLPYELRRIEPEDLYD